MKILARQLFGETGNVPKRQPIPLRERADARDRAENASVGSRQSENTMPLRLKTLRFEPSHEVSGLRRHESGELAFSQ
jgi:hypothetical protein